ncbi:3D domain-containing protein [Thermoactinomyces sp. CICC 10521]|uniref:3D domain-containing protein n=1 Tax=Thermoactinomyces sp. CICC 10521 TaxID=2767426 RepID=UPI0018DE6FE1|nr:3D domain-containing protein [Thermoactinomyces sp. CICC 10521]MBH8609220.1 G5 domain-containing protein [Thermoactinomyces sp. CICC 10521]
MKRILLNSLAMILILPSLLTGCSEPQQVKVTFSDQPKIINLENNDDTLASSLTKQGYSVAELKQNYEPSIPWDQKLGGQKTVQLTCKCRVSLSVAGKDLGTFQTTQETVEDVLNSKKVQLTAWDEINVPLNQKIKEGTKIVVDRLEQRVKKKVEEVPYKTKKIEDNQMADGKTEVKQDGKEGKKVYQVTMLYKNGQPVVEDGEPVVTQKLIDSVEPVEKIVKVGTNKEMAQKESVNLTSAKETGTLTVEATGYTATGSRTATGTYPHRGTIAVDPDVIPLGTKLYIPGYGYGVAEDTGGAINGKIIDLFFDSEQEAINWGRRTVTIKILK